MTDPLRRHVRPTAAAAVVDGVTASLDAAASRHFAAAGDAGSGSPVHLPRTGPGSARVRRHARPRLTRLVAATALAACAWIFAPLIVGGA